MVYCIWYHFLILRAVAEVKGKTKQPESYPFLTRLVEKTATERSKDPTKILDGAESAWHTSIFCHFFLIVFVISTFFLLLSSSIHRNMYTQRHCGQDIVP